MRRDPELVGRLKRGDHARLDDGGLQACAKHWPDHGDVAVDNHITLATLPLTRERLDTVEWAPYRQARAAGLESVMTGHLLVPAIDPDNCATVSPALIRILREGWDLRPDLHRFAGHGGLRLTLDSAEAAWRSLAAGHDQGAHRLQAPALGGVDAVIAACLDGRVPEARLRDAAARVRALKARRAQLPPQAPAAGSRRRWPPWAASSQRRR